MKWKKLGKIFDPTEHNLPNNCTEFAQSPQALIYDDFVRIYFSTRARDKTGKFLSYVAFVDFDKKFQTILSVSQHTVLPLGNLGCYDEHGIFPFHVIRKGKKVLGYICGWQRKLSVPVETSIGLSISRDHGLTFKRIGDGPILTSSIHEPFLVGDPFVMIDKNGYHMWYIYGTRWINFTNRFAVPERVYKIAHATSCDGIAWEKEGRQIISDKICPDECQALPSVIKHRGIYHMLFCYRDAVDFRKNKKKSYRIGYAFSKDMINWTRADDEAGIDVSPSGWDSEMIAYPHVFAYDKNIYMLYNGNEFGRLGFGLALLQS